NIGWGPGCGFGFLKNLAALVFNIFNCENSSNVDRSNSLSYQNSIHVDLIFRSQVDHAHFVLGLSIFQDRDLLTLKVYNISLPKIYEGYGHIIYRVYFDQLAFHNP